MKLLNESEQIESNVERQTEKAKENEKSVENLAFCLLFGKLSTVKQTKHPVDNLKFKEKISLLDLNGRTIEWMNETKDAINEETNRK